MQFLVDTHVLFWILTFQQNKLSKKVQNFLKTAEELVIPTIVLLELLGLLEKKRERKFFEILLNQIPNSKYLIVPLDLPIIEEVNRIKNKLELHDKVIIASAKILNLPILTKDKEIKKVYNKTAW